MKSVLAGFGSGVSKPPNRSSPAPAAAQNQAQSANQAPNPASAFSGLVNNISNSAKKQEQGSSSFGGFSFGLPTSLKLILRVDLLGQKCSNPLLMKRDQIFDWTHYLNSTVWAVERYFQNFQKPSPYGQNDSMQSNNSFLDLIILLIISCFSSILPFCFHFSLIFSTCLSPTYPTHLLWMSIHHPSPSENNCQATLTWKF